MGFPAISDTTIMARYNHARDNERDALIDMVELHPGCTTLDIQAAGGYLSDGIYERLGGDVTCLCVEPCAQLRNRLNTRYQIIDNPVDNFFSVPANSVDAVLGLAGLHHSDSHSGTVNESFRVLKPGGMFTVCDVIEGSRLSSWLNDFVSHNTPTGHDGRFIEHGAVTELMKQAGFTELREEVKSVPWLFGSREAVITLFKGLFGLTCPEQDIAAVVDDYFHIHREGERIVVDWELIYASGRKPPTH